MVVPASSSSLSVTTLSNLFRFTRPLRPSLFFFSSTPCSSSFGPSFSFSYCHFSGKSSFGWRFFFGPTCSTSFFLPFFPPPPTTIDCLFVQDLFPPRSQDSLWSRSDDISPAVGIARALCLSPFWFYLFACLFPPFPLMRIFFHFDFSQKGQCPPLLTFPCNTFFSPPSPSQLPFVLFGLFSFFFLLHTFP